jgi:Uma2 family endonuclease
MIRSDLLTPSQPQPRQLRFSVDDYYKMIELGMIEDYEKAEIIDGQMVQKMTIGDKHAFVVDSLNRYLNRNLADSILVRIQNPLRLDDFSEPEPDVVLADLTKYDGKRHPRPAETILVIEVSDKSLKYDHDTKLPMYAEAGIREVWIVNLEKNVVEVHHEPNVGLYQRVDVFERGGVIASPSLPDLKLVVNDILG